MVRDGFKLVLQLEPELRLSFVQHFAGTRASSSASLQQLFAPIRSNRLS